MNSYHIDNGTQVRFCVGSQYLQSTRCDVNLTLGEIRSWAQFLDQLCEKHQGLKLIVKQ